MTRLLPSDMYLAYSGLFLQPYSPEECDPTFLENRVLHLDGEFEGVSIPLDVIERMQQFPRRTQDEIVQLAKEEVRAQLSRIVQCDGVFDPMDMAEYEGDASGFNMSRDELQLEFDQLCKEFGFPVEVAVKIASPVIDDVLASTMLYGMPRARQPHQAIVHVFPMALSFCKPVIRTIIRHEFAHCLSDCKTWPQGETSLEHWSPEWDQACERLGIKPDSGFEAFEDGYFKYTCPECGNTRFSLNDDGDLHDLYVLCEWDEHCEICGAKYSSELRHEPLTLADSGVYAVQEDGRELLLVAPPEELLPECFWC